MIEVNTAGKLEERLRHMCRNAKNSGLDQLSGEEVAYISGLEDALELVCLYRQQRADVEDAIEETAENQPDATGAVKLFQMSAEQVAALNLDAQDEACLDSFSQEELVEAAFRFENELMSCLEDANCIAWEVYAGLTPGELIKVVSRSVSDICKYTGKG